MYPHADAHRRGSPLLLLIRLAVAVLLSAAVFGYSPTPETSLFTSFASATTVTEEERVGTIRLSQPRTDAVGEVGQEGSTAEDGVSNERRFGAHAKTPTKHLSSTHTLTETLSVTLSASPRSPSPPTPSPTRTIPTPPPYMGPCIPCPEYGLSPAEQMRLNMTNGVAHVVRYAINETANQWGYAAVRYCTACNTSGGFTYVMKPSIDNELLATIVGAAIGIVAAGVYLLALRCCCRGPLRARRGGGSGGSASRAEMANLAAEAAADEDGGLMGMGDREAAGQFAGNYQQQQQMGAMLQMMGMMGGQGGGGGAPPSGGFGGGNRGGQPARASQQPAPVAPPRD